VTECTSVVGSTAPPSFAEAQATLDEQTSVTATRAAKFTAVPEGFVGGVARLTDV
jgi:hypothetical protein